MIKPTKKVPPLSYWLNWLDLVKSKRPEMPKKKYSVTFVDHRLSDVLFKDWLKETTVLPDVITALKQLILEIWVKVCQQVTRKVKNILVDLTIFQKIIIFTQEICFDRENFFLDLLSIDWDDNIDENNVNTSFENFHSEISKLLDKYMPLKKISNREFKRTYKPWITDGILNSINRKDKLYNKYVKTKNKTTKEELHKDYKMLQNHVNELNYYGKYFAKYTNNIKKIWQGIKAIVNIKSKNYNSPTSIEVGNKLVTNPIDICNNFNDYFSTIAENILTSSKHPILNSFDKYLTNSPENSFVFEPCDPSEVNLLINQLNPSKSSGPN